MFQDLGPITDPQTIDTITVTTRITPPATFIWLDTETGDVYVDYERMYKTSQTAGNVTYSLVIELKDDNVDEPLTSSYVFLIYVPGEKIVVDTNST